jgi:hypothetical protein
MTQRGQFRATLDTTRVLRKIDGRWHIVVPQNTDVRHGRRH